MQNKLLFSKNLICVFLLLCLCLTLGCKAEKVSQAPNSASPVATILRAEQTAIATPGPTPAPTLTPSPSPAPTPFTLVWISDTQSYTYYNEYFYIFPQMMDWVSNNIERHNIVAMLHTGDVTENGWRDSCWVPIDEGLKKIEGKLPYLIVAGNHDLGSKLQEYGSYLQRNFVTQMDEQTKYQDGKGCYMTFEAGGTDFIVVGLGYDMLAQEDMDWACSVFDAHADHVGIFITHSYLGLTGNSPHGKLLSNGIISKCKNVRLVMCGHYRGVLSTVETFDDDGDGVDERTVNVMRYNYQDTPQIPGYLRTLTFDPTKRSISVSTYSPVLDDYVFDDSATELEQFILENGF